MCFYCYTRDKQFKKIGERDCMCVGSSTAISGSGQQRDDELGYLFCWNCKHTIENVKTNNGKGPDNWPLSCADAMGNATILGVQQQQSYYNEQYKDMHDKMIPPRQSSLQ